MAIVPKRKTSKARRDKRRANWKLKKLPTLRICDHCGMYHLFHRVCKHCGYYRGRQVILKKEA